MGQEIELKFEIDEASIEPLCLFFKTQHIEQYHELGLTNTYYDTDDNLLKHHRSSVRIRTTREQNKQDQYEITVKSGGSAIAGLHTRRELNVSLINDQLDLSVLPAEAFAANIDINKLSQQITALFTTDFYRKTWLITYKQSKIEIAFDKGQVTAENLSNAIFEIELELKTGSSHDLLLFAIELSQFNIHLFSQSKAARGYRLLQGQGLHKLDQLVINDNESILHNILTFWQMNEEFALLYNDLATYQHTLQQVHLSLETFLASAHIQSANALMLVYSSWCQQIQSILDIKAFAYSEINTKLKLYLMLLVA